MFGKIASRKQNIKILIRKVKKSISKLNFVTCTFINHFKTYLIMHTVVKIPSGLEGFLNT